MFFLHFEGSSNPLGFSETLDKVPFHMYYTIKDVMGFFCFFILSFLFIFYFPWVLGEPDNFIPADPLVTPLHIKPEWYFLWAYAVLRSIPNKLGGVMTMFAAVFVLFLPGVLVGQNKKGSQYYFTSQVEFWCFIIIILLLTKLGGLPVSVAVEVMGQGFTLLFFIVFFLFSYSGVLEDNIMNLM